MTCEALHAAALSGRITPTQNHVLTLIDAGLAKRADMARIIGKEIVTVARAIDALVKLKWVKRTTVAGKPSLLSVDHTRIMDDTTLRGTRIAHVTGDESRITNDPTSRNLDDTGGPNDTATRITDDTAQPAAAVDNAGAHIEHVGARGTANLKTTATDQIRSDPITKDELDALVERAGAAADPTAPNLRHGAVINRLMRGGCDFEQDILPAVDKLAASFARSGKKLFSWELLVEHATEFRDRRLQGIPAPVPRAAPPRPASRNGIRRNLYLGERCAV